MEKEILAEKIVVYKNVIEDGMSIIKEIEEGFKSFGRTWGPSIIGDYREVNTDLRSCTILNLTPDPGDSKEFIKMKNDLDNKINKKIIKALADYNKTYGFQTKSKEPWEVCRYEETQKLIWHKDNGPAHPCQVSYVLYFNDDYEGGAIQFKDHLDGYPYQPLANSLVVFPSSEDFIHRVLPTTKGVRYAAISFAL